MSESNKPRNEANSELLPLQHVSEEEANRIMAEALERLEASQTRRPGKWAKYLRDMLAKPVGAYGIIQTRTPEEAVKYAASLNSTRAVLGLQSKISIKKVGLVIRLQRLR